MGMGMRNGDGNEGLGMRDWNIPGNGTEGLRLVQNEGP